MKTRLAVLALCLAASIGAPLALASDAGPAPESVTDAGPTADAGPAAASTEPQSQPLDDTFPVDEAGELVTLIRAGKWLPAFGVLIIMLTWAVRAGLKGLFDRPKSQWGKHVLAGSISAALVVAAALRVDEVSFGLIAAALGAYWTASGGYDTGRDLVAWLRKKLG